MLEFTLGNRQLSFNTETKNLHYKDQVFSPDIRKYADIAKLYEGKSDMNTEDGVYFMYRDIYFSDAEKSVFQENHIRFDITILIPQLFGEEFNKTYGHFHPKNKEGKYFEEVYEVLHGDVKFLLQNDDEVYYTDASVGDTVLMKEGFGHVSINPSETNYLVMMDLVDDSFSSIYDVYSEKLGAQYFYTKKGWSENSNYGGNPKLQEKTQKLSFSTNIYDEFLQFPEKFGFLK